MSRYTRHRAAGALVARILLKSKWEGDCLVWQGAVGTHGYGSTACSSAIEDVFGRKSGILVHDAICRLVNGEKRYKRHEVLHSCDNKLCVNPKHLRWGTRGQNLMEAHERTLHPHHGQGHTWAKVSNDDLRTILERAASGERVKALAEEYGISWSSIYRWQRGESRIKYLDERAPDGDPA